MKLISVNLLNKDQKEYLGPCIDSVLKQTYSDVEVIIIDNNSTDGSQEFITRNFPNIRLIRNTTNEGYARTHNQAIRISRGEYIMPLNIDLVLTGTFIEEMVKAIEMEEGIGMAQGRLYRMHNKSGEKIFDSAGIGIRKDRRNYIRGYGEADRGQYDNMEYIFAASGEAPLYKRKMLEDVKINGEYFDENFFMYREDIDIAWRAQLLGWRCVYTPYAVAYHLRRYSPSNRRSMPKNLRSLQYRNRYLMIVKNELPANFLRDFIFILSFELCFFVYSLIKETYLLKNWIEIIRLLPGTMRKRKLIMKKQKVTAKYLRGLIR